MQNDHDLALRISGVTKEYHLGQIGTGTLYRDLQSWFARVRGKEDPNQKIGHAKRLVGDSFMALNGIDLEVKKGEALGIIGANGAGKSTLLKLLSQVTGPTSGTIELFGRVSSMLEVGTGFNGEMTGRENVYMNGAILGMTKAEISTKMENIIEFSEVRDFIDTPVKRYSSGMYVKLAFSVAAHLDSEIIIMDEVLAVGDMAFQKKCLERMRIAAKQEGRTVLYVSHNMDTIQRLCDRCIVLNQGKIIYDGDVNHAIEHYLNCSDVLFDQKEYADADHELQYASERFSVKAFELLGRNIPEYDSGEHIQFRLRCSAECSLDHFSMHFIIMRGAKQLGSALPSERLVFPQGDHWMDFDLDTSQLPEGNYTVKYVFHQTTDYGSIERLDIITNGFNFRILEKSFDELAPVWEPNTWGPVKLNRMTVNIKIGKG